VRPVAPCGTELGEHRTVQREPANSACRRGNGGSGHGGAGNAVASGAISGPIRNILVITCAKVTPMHLPDAHARAPGNYTALSDLV